MWMKDPASQEKGLVVFLLQKLGCQMCGPPVVRLFRGLLNRPPIYQPL